MLSSSKLFDLVAEAFDEDAMREAVEEKISELIDYSELAEAIVEQHSCEIDGIIADMAEDAL